MRDGEMMESITRFRCGGCGKKHEVNRHDDGKVRPPKSWRWVEANTFRAHHGDSDFHNASGLACSPPCAAAIVADSWLTVAA